MNRFSLSDKFVRQCIGFCLISVAVAFVYYPSLLHIPRADHITYFAETRHLKSFWDLTGGSYDLNRRLFFNPGDEVLFRPIVYFFLGAQKFLFGNNFLLWQLMGILLHLVVVWQLLALFFAMRPGKAAIIASAFFALLTSNMEMVIWSHITGYMIFLICFLKIARIMFLDQINLGRERIVLLLLMLMCFTHELGFLFCGVVAFWKLSVDRTRGLRPEIFLLPGALYILVSALNFWSRGNIYSEGSQVLGLPTLKIIGDALIMVGWWILYGIAPAGGGTIILGERTMIDLRAPFPLPVVDFMNPYTYMYILFLTGFVILLTVKARSIVLDVKTKVWVFAIVSILVLFVAMILFGRASPRGLQITIFQNLYYSYIFWLMFLMILFATFARVSFKPKETWVFASCLAVLIIHNAFLIYSYNVIRADASNNTNILLRVIHLLVKERRSDEDFSFYVAPSYPGNFLCWNVRRIPDRPDEVFNFIEILYPEYYREQNAKFKFLSKIDQ